LIFVEKELKKKGAKYINISQPPENHGNQNALNEVLNDLKYKVKSKRIFHGVPITEKDFASKMSVMEQRRLKKCIKAGFEFKSIPSTLEI
jgi:pyruvate/2-oxoacid:ferredoxin oxidoreductase beta subunit